MSNGYVYLRQPYSHPDAVVREYRFEASCIKTASLMRQGYTVFSPIAHSHPVAAYLPEDLLMSHEFWMKQDLPILEHADKLIVLVLDGWRESQGLRREIQYAWNCDMDIELHNMDGIWLPSKDDSAIEYLREWTAEAVN